VSPSSSDAEPTVRGPAAGQRVFGRYTLQAMLGRGGMGVVWRARDETLGEEVALKFLPDAVRWDPAAFDDLKAETRRARQLTHPNIVRIHDFVEDMPAGRRFRWSW
jgi:serine/threonine protein kinase